jgi:hypothetical protein
MLKCEFSIKMFDIISNLMWVLLMILSALTQGVWVSHPLMAVSNSTHQKDGFQPSYNTPGIKDHSLPGSKTCSPCHWTLVFISITRRPPHCFLRYTTRNGPWDLSGLCPKEPEQALSYELLACWSHYWGHLIYEGARWKSLGHCVSYTRL